MFDDCTECSYGKLCQLPDSNSDSESDLDSNSDSNRTRIKVHILGIAHSAFLQAAVVQNHWIMET